jgi:hypothetical protein
VVDELVKCPGQWALVQECVPPSHVNSWLLFGCEAVSRKSPTDPGTANIYARWPK